MGVVNAVVFDLYGTLITLDAVTRPLLRSVIDSGLKDRRKFHQARIIALTKDFGYGDKFSLERFLQSIKDDLQINFQESRQMDLSSYESDLEAEITSARLYSDVKETLSALKKQKIPIGLISNLASPYIKPFFALGLGEYFDEANRIFSCSVGTKKPDAEIYGKMLKALHLEPERVLIVGNSRRNDVIAPISYGMLAYHVARHKGRPLDRILEEFEFQAPK